MIFLISHASIICFVFLLALYTLFVCLSKKNIARFFLILLFLHALFSVATLCDVPFKTLYKHYIEAHIPVLSCDLGTLFYAIISLLIIGMIACILLHMRHPESTSDYPNLSDQERQQEAIEAFKNLTNDYSSLLKFLITLSSSSIVFSGSFLEKHGITPSIKFSWMCWSCCIILSLISLGLSIYNQNKHIEQLCDLNIEATDLEQPSNAGEYTCTTLAGISFAVAFSFFTLSIWTNIPQKTHKTEETRETSLVLQSGPFMSPWRSGLPSAWSVLLIQQAQTSRSPYLVVEGKVQKRIRRANFIRIHRLPCSSEEAFSFCATRNPSNIVTAKRLFQSA